VQLAGRPYARVFFIDAATFVVSFLCIARLTQLGPSAATEADGDEHTDLRFRDAFAIPLVAAVMPAALAVSLGLGALFSLGIVFVRDVLHASDAEFGVLIALFGVGAVLGLVVLQRLPAGNLLARTRVGVLWIGVVVALFSLAPALWVALFGAVAFGAGAAFSLAAGMGAIQSSLDGRQRVLAFTAFHVVLRVGLAISAVGAGIAGDLLTNVHWPVVGTLQPARLVLLSAGILVFASASLVRVRGEDA
jgi:predicted MFS family arabinose efflux permease